LNDEKRKEIQVGDEIIFTHYDNPKKQIKVKVIGLSKFDSFSELYSSFPNEKFGHKKEITLNEQIENVRKIYSEEKEKKYGVLGIHIELIK
jgi:ASC-1-like (ASCH) protein